MPVEVQIRTIAMDFWATLEHQLRYKAIPTIPASISDELVQTATDIALLDQRMQRIHDQVDDLKREFVSAKLPRKIQLILPSNPASRKHPNIFSAIIDAICRRMLS